MPAVSHEFEREGTATLSAALKTVTEPVTAESYKRQRRRAFPQFMNEVVRDRADRETHVILDILNSRKPKGDLRSAKHGNALHSQPSMRFGSIR